jgi:hypothetical protein
MNLDIVLAGDFRFPGGTSTAVADEVRTLAEAGLRVGMLQVNSMALDSQALPTHPEIQACWQQGWAERVGPFDGRRCRLLAFHHPVVLERTPAKAFRIDAAHRLMIVHHVPMDPMGRLNYDPWTIEKNAEAAFGGPFIWAPVSPICRERLEACGFNGALLAVDWHSVFRIEDWGAARERQLFPRITLGRHSRPDRDKWPASRSAMLAAYPDDPQFAVRILGGGRELKQLIGSYPENWTVFAFNEVSVRSFLHTIDYYVYFHHPAWIETFGRGPAEAAAAGCIVVLPPYLEATFGPAALYCAPEEAPSLLQSLHASPARFRDQSALARRYLDKAYGPAHFVSVVQQVIDNPKTTADGPGKRAGPLRWRLRLTFRAKKLVLAARVRLALGQRLRSFAAILSRKRK